MFRPISLFAAASTLAFSSAAFAQDLTPEQAKAREIYETVIGIRTARGQAKMPEMVDYLVSEFKAAGFTDEDIKVTDYDSQGEPTQGLMVWYRAEEPVQKPIVLLAHMDVVDALAEDWERPPFTLIEDNGYFFGRGTADNKYGVVNLTQTFIRLKQEGWVPNRDLVLAFSGDEETGMISTIAQADYTAEFIDPEFVLNSDAGSGELSDAGVPTLYAVQGAEKTYATFELTVRNPGGHSSRPRADNAIYELADALKAIQGYEFPAKSSPLTRATLAAEGAATEGELGAAMRAFAEDPSDEDATAVLRANPKTVGTIGTTCIATMLRGGHAENALPQSVTATVNCRIFPGETIKATQATLEAVVGNEAVEFNLLDEYPESPESALREDVLAAVKLALADRGIDVPITPYMSSGGTDGMHYRTRGYDTLGISAAFSKTNDTYAHGLNERLLVDEFYAGLDHWSLILKELAGD